jgi:sulfonate transport system substrate-binding protein
MTASMLRPVAALAAALALAGGVAACGSSSKSTSSTSSSSSSAASAAAATTSTTATTVAATGHISGPTLRVGDQAGTGAQALLQAAGLLHSFSFPIKFADFTSGPPIVQAMSAGALDVGNLGNAPIVFAGAGGDKIKVVGALSNVTKNVAVLVPKGSKITSVSQLKGKKIAVAEGTSGDYHLLYELQQAGLSPKDVSLVNLQPAQGYSAFESGAVSAWDVWPPFVQEAEAKGARNIATNPKFPGDNSFEIAADSAISSPAKSKEIQEYLTVLNRAHRWANTHPAQWAKTWGAATGLPASIMLAAAKDTIQTPVPVNASIESEEQGLVKVFYTSGLIPKSFPISDYMTSQFNSTVH